MDLKDSVMLFISLSTFVGGILGAIGTVIVKYVIIGPLQKDFERMSDELQRATSAINTMNERFNDVVKAMGVYESNQKTLFRYVDEFREELKNLENRVNTFNNL